MLHMESLYHQIKFLPHDDIHLGACHKQDNYKIQIISIIPYNMMPNPL